MTREPHVVSNVEVMEHLGNSDHNMVTFSVHHVQETLDSMTLFHDYCKGDYQSIRKELADIDWDIFMSEDTINCWSKFRDLLLDLQQRFISYRLRKSVKLVTRGSPFG